MSTLQLRRQAARRPSWPQETGRLAILLAGLRATVADWRRRHRARAELGRMSDRELRDLGVTRAEAEREAAMPFWR